MPYIGTQPTKVVSRQSANVYRYTATAGQSVFTGADLDNNVLACNPADMIVHMNGLRLESTDYTATSTTVTLTTAATAGDEVTVTSFQTFEVADTYDKATADTRYVNASGDTISGNVTVDSGNELRVNRPDNATYGAISHGAAGTGIVYNDLNGDGHHFQFNGATQMNIDASGRVTMPYQTAGFFRGPNQGFASAASWTDLNLDSTEISRGGISLNATNNRITLPVGGYYFVTFMNALNVTSNLRAYGIRLFLNGTAIRYGNYFAVADPNTGTTHGHATGSWLINLNANDYISFSHISYDNISNSVDPQITVHLLG